MSTVIKVENLSKRYIIGRQQQERYLTLRDSMTRKFKEAGKKLLHPFLSSSGQPLMGTANTEEFWALKNVSFEVNQGDRIGIIGKNGAGKSTLLKILSRITDPTSGKIRIKGRVASLLEVGTGFHRELTGKENIFLNGAILGMTKAEIKKKFDEIVVFSEIEKFLDTPVKRYSSGMYVRLAFAVAAHLESEILLVDEVLAVGDAQFQKKCLGKMEEVRKDGRTILFVSHNMTAVHSLCEKAVWLVSGKIAQSGNADSVVSMYLQNGAHIILNRNWESPDSAPGNEKVRLHSVRVGYDKGVDQHEQAHITIYTPIKIETRFWNFIPDARLNLTIHVHTIEGVHLFSTASHVFAAPEGIVTGICHIPGNLLNEGTYSIAIVIVRDSKRVFRMNDALTFDVHETHRDSSWYGKWPGLVRPKLEWDITVMGDVIS